MNNWTTNFTRQFHGLRQVVESFVRKVLIFLVGVYRTFGSQFLGGQCRFQPSCSHYALEALQTQSVPTALQLIIKRISRCHPFGSSGWDPVPARKENSNAREQSAVQTL